MKQWLVFIFLCALIFQCKKTEIVTQNKPICDCKTGPVAYGGKNLEATIFFPIKPGFPYRIVVPKLFTGDEASFAFNICADSLSTNVIRSQRITDGSTVICDGGLVEQPLDYFDKTTCNGLAAFRLTKLVKVR